MKPQIKLTLNEYWDGVSPIYAVGRSTFGMVKVEPENIRVYQDSEDVVNCQKSGTLWLSDSKVFLYTVEPHTSYVCVTTMDKSVAERNRDAKQ